MLQILKMLKMLKMLKLLKIDGLVADISQSYGQSSSTPSAHIEILVSIVYLLRHLRNRFLLMIQARACSASWPLLIPQSLCMIEAPRSLCLRFDRCHCS